MAHATVFSSTAPFYLCPMGHYTDAPEDNLLGLTDKDTLNEQEALGGGVSLEHRRGHRAPPPMQDALWYALDAPYEANGDPPHSCHSSQL